MDDVAVEGRSDVVMHVRLVRDVEGKERKRTNLASAKFEGRSTTMAPP